MEYILVPIVIVLMIFIISSLSSLKGILKGLNVKVYELQQIQKEILNSLHVLKTQVSSIVENPDTIIEQEPVPLPATPEQTHTNPIEDSVPEPIQFSNDIYEEANTNPVFEETAPLLNDENVQTEEIPQREKISKAAINWEKFIGENLINKFGIAILTIGVGIFVKFAIDNQWINEVGRVLIGLGAGLTLLIFAHILRKEYKAFSSVLIGGGIVILYFTMGLSFHVYKMFDQNTAFVLMVLITAFAVALSLLYNRIEVAVIALIGGFATPFLVSTGQGDFTILFTYILILNIGMLTLAYYRKWNLVYIIAYVFTVILFAGWLFTGYLPGNAFYALFFATAFYIIFFLAAITFNIRKNVVFRSFDYLILFSVNLVYFSAGLYILNGVDNGAYNGLFTAALAVINFTFAYFLYRKKDLDKNFVYLLIGIILTYVTLVAPIQLKGNQITLFWAAESTILLWLYLKSDLKMLRIASLILLPLMLLSLIMDWDNNYSSLVSLDKPLWPLLNKVFVTGCGVILALYLRIRFTRKEFSNETQGQSFTFNEAQNYAIVIIGFLVGILEVNYQFRILGGAKSGNQLSITADLIYTAIYLYVLQRFIVKKQISYLINAVNILLAAISILHISYYNFKVIDIRDLVLEAKIQAWQFYLHYLIIPFLLLGNRQTYLQLNHENDKTLKTGAIWFFCFYGIYLLSMEIDHIAMLCFSSEHVIKDPTIHIVHKVVYPIVWGIASFILMFIGMRQKIKTLRIFSLSLFGLILIKLFLIDFREMSEGGRIAAFISLGVILLVISFLYQKLKQLIFDNEA